MIRVSQVRVISSEGTQLGVMATSEALAKARDLGLDLVEVAPDAKPPVCKIMHQRTERTVIPGVGQSAVDLAAGEDKASVFA